MLGVVAIATLKGFCWLPNLWNLKMAHHTWVCVCVCAFIVNSLHICFWCNDGDDENTHIKHPTLVAIQLSKLGICRWVCGEVRWDIVILQKHGSYYEITPQRTKFWWVEWESTVQMWRSTIQLWLQTILGYCKYTHWNNSVIEIWMS